MKIIITLEQNSENHISVNIASEPPVTGQTKLGPLHRLAHALLEHTRYLMAQTGQKEVFKRNTFNEHFE